MFIALNNGYFLVVYSHRNVYSNQSVVKVLYSDFTSQNESP